MTPDKPVGGAMLDVDPVEDQTAQLQRMKRRDRRRTFNPHRRAS